MRLRAFVCVCVRHTLILGMSGTAAVVPAGMPFVVLATAFGGPEVLSVAGEPVPAAGPGEARIEVRARRACTLSRGDSAGGRLSHGCTGTAAGGSPPSRGTSVSSTTFHECEPSQNDRVIPQKSSQPRTERERRHSWRAVTAWNLHTPLGGTLGGTYPLGSGSWPGENTANWLVLWQPEPSLPSAHQSEILLCRGSVR